MSVLRQGVLAAVVLGAAGMAQAAVYVDAQNETHDGNANLDITQVEVTNDATNISFKISLRGSIASPTDWGKYTIGLDTTAGGNSNQNTSGNAWGRAISMPGMDYWIGSWVDSGGGALLYQWTGSAWNQTGSPSNTIASPSLTLTTSLASLGLSNGSVVKFDVYTTGGNGGDGANDAAGNASQASSGWSAHYDSGTNVLQYTVVVPEPASLGLLSLGSVALLRRRRLA